MVNILFWVLNVAGMALVLTVGLNGEVTGLYALVGGNALVLISFMLCIITRARGGRDPEPDYWEEQEREHERERSGRGGKRGG